MRRQQQGITAIGFIIIAAMVGVIGFTGLRLIPVMMTQMKVRQILSDIEGEFSGQNPSPNVIQAAIGRRLNIEMIDFPTKQDFRITKSADGYEVSVAYEDRAPLIANLSVVADFDNAIEIKP